MPSTHTHDPGESKKKAFLTQRVGLPGEGCAGVCINDDIESNREDAHFIRLMDKGEMYPHSYLKNVTVQKKKRSERGVFLG